MLQSALIYKTLQSALIYRTPECCQFEFEASVSVAEGVPRIGSGPCVTTSTFPCRRRPARIGAGAGFSRAFISLQRENAGVEEGA